MPFPRHPRMSAARNWIYATPAQEVYLDRLWAEVQRYRTAEWVRSKRRYLKSEASREIDMLRTAIARGKREAIKAST